MQILNGKAHWKFEAEAPPVFAPNIHIVDITDLDPKPDEGWQFADGQFQPPPNLIPGDLIT
ncbi:hypothetical protein [Bordetella avium]|uniref:hypothetical protein n=1 Tax=Bordetella avium TaxID=521 RepID=UPI000FD98F6C|nr:hypothetical protein [Bordetella avium]AZY53268.1 hypothetical protein C0J07_12865 [Bordetella avium]